MSFFLLLREEPRLSPQFSSDKIRVSLKDTPVPNRRTKYDRTNLTCLRGDDEYYIFDVWSGNDKAKISQSTIIATGRVKEKDDNPLFSFVLPNDENIGADFENGRFVFHIPKDITKDLPTLLKYDIKVIDSDNKVYTLVSGQIEVRTEYLLTGNLMP